MKHNERRHKKFYDCVVERESVMLNTQKRKKKHGPSFQKPSVGRKEKHTPPVGLNYRISALLSPAVR